jgi:hypothetical protein
MKPSLDNFLGYSRIKGKEADAHKTTLIIIWGTMTDKFLLFGVPYASTSFKRPIQTTMDKLISTLVDD